MVFHAWFLLPNDFLKIDINYHAFHLRYQNQKNVFYAFMSDMLFWKEVRDEETGILTMVQSLYSNLWYTESYCTPVKTYLHLYFFQWKKLVSIINWRVI